MTDTNVEPTGQQQGATPAPAHQQPAQEQPKTDQPNGDKPLGEAGLKALQAERERGDRLERELSGLKPLQEQMTALQRAFGGKSEGETPEDVIKGLQRQMSQMQRDSLVDNVARRHGITSDDDIAYLRLAPDADAMTKLAERLKVTQTATPPQTDPGQGARSTTPQQVRDAEYEQFFPNPSR